jgi:ankyrin
MKELLAHELFEVLNRVQDPNIRVLSLVCASWRSLIRDSPRLRVAILVRQLRGRILVKALSQDPPLVDIVKHLPQDFDWSSEATLALEHACHKGLTEVVELLLVKGARADGSWLRFDYSCGCSPLYLACRGGHIAVARTLIEHGATVMPGNSWRGEGKGPEGRSALHAACEGGYPDVAKLLLNNGADVKYTGLREVNPLHIACTLCSVGNEMNTVTTIPSQFAHMAAKSYHDEVGVLSAVGACSADRVAVVALLVAVGADMNKLDGGGMSPLSLACKHGLVGVVELLISHGVDINLEVGTSEKTALSIACTLDQVGMAQLLLANGANVNHPDIDGMTPLHEACAWGRSALVQLLLAWGANVSKACEQGWTPLHHACYAGHSEVASFLLAAGASVSCTGQWGRTPLDRACLAGHTEVATLLLAAGASVNCADKDGYTPLHFACHYGRTEVATLVMAAGASVNCTDEFWWTPLHHASIGGHTEVATLLVAAGASVSCTNKCGMTPLKLAKDRAPEYRADMVSLLAAAEKQERGRDKDGPAHPKRARTNK